MTSKFPLHNDSLSKTTLTQEQEDRLLEAFTLFDDDRDGLISTKELCSVMRALDLNLTLCEETDIIAHYALEKCTEIDFRSFLKFTSTKLKETDNDTVLRESFRRFDKEETGQISVAFLKNSLMTVGEPLSEYEVDEWLKDGESFIDDGFLNYEKFATHMLSK